MDCAGIGDMLYIAWETSATNHGGRRTYRGVDRFRLKDGIAVEEHVIFDSAVLTPEGRGGIEQVNTAVSQMDKITQQNAALVEEAAAAAKSMEEQTTALGDMVANFVLPAGYAGPAPGAPRPAPRRPAEPVARRAATQPADAADDVWKEF